MLNYLHDRKSVLCLGMLILLITSMPYMAGYFCEGESWRFTGFVIGVEDGNSYIAKMLRGANGDWLFRTPYSAIEQKGFLAFLPYILLGKLSVPPGQHEQLVGLYQFYRWIAGLLMILATYDFVSLFIKEKRIRLFSTALATAGGGAGWLAMNGLQLFQTNRMPLEFYSPETFGFLSIFGTPHLALSRALMLWGLVLFMKNQSAVIIGLIWFVMSLFQPLTVITGCFYLGISIAVRFLLYILKDRQNRKPLLDEVGNEILSVFIIGVISSPVIVNTFISINSDPFVSQWTKQNIIKSPPFVDYIISFLFFLPFLTVGIWREIKSIKSNQWNTNHIFLLGWFTAFPILAYFPNDVQRRLPDGIWVAIIIFSVLCVSGFTDKIQKGIYRFFILSFIPSLIIVAGGLVMALNPGRPVFQPDPAVKAYLFLDENVEKDAVLLSSFETGNALPAWAPIRVLIGHGPESANLKKYRPSVEAFYKNDGMSSDQRYLFLKDNQIDYVFIGENEKELGDWIPGDKEKYLIKIYDSDGYQIYSVIKDGSF